MSTAQDSRSTEEKIDSLRQSIKSAKHDTTIVNSWKAWDNLIYIADPEMDLNLNQRIDSLCSINLEKKLSTIERMSFLKSKGFSLNNLGIIYQERGDYGKANDFHTESLAIKKIIGDKNGIAASLNNIGLIYRKQGDYDKAIDYYTKSLSIYEEIDIKTGIATALLNIGSIYHDQDDFDKAIDYYTESLAIKEEIENKSGIASSLNNIGAVYREQGNLDKALDFYTRSLSINEEIGNKLGMSYSLNLIGIIYQDQENYDKATDYYTKSLRLSEEMGGKSGIISSLNSLGNIAYKQGHYEKAIDYSSRALAMAQEIGFALMVRNSAKSLWTFNKHLGRSKESLEMYELYIATKDSMASKDNQKAIIQQEYKYAYEKQAAADSVKTAEADKVKDALLIAEKAENKQNQQQQYFLYVGLGLALLFAAIIFNRFKLANKQKAIIEEQKLIVDEAYDGLEEAHKEITDSINYAERIQGSFLATTELLEANLNEHFVFFQPKDVVSGDFYWAAHLADGNFAILNADSTGHGVPGAIMSILNISSIESAVKDKLTKPADIFNDARKTIIERLKKDGSPEGGKDGMDASLLSFNADKSKMTYVAAQNPIWIIREGELIDIKAEKMPVSKHDYDHIPFEGGEIELQKGDIIYTLTDGYQDQFGGEKGKKYKVKPLKRLLLEICELPLKEQHQQISDTFDEWKGDLEQVDDVCIIGVRI
ncbi:MAG: tetratricopeptide (TPR) repeat protein [Arenicella sp.]